MNFVSLTKPGIIFGNTITLVGAYFLGARDHVELSILFFTILGMALVIASGCVFNNYIDRDIDQLMQRTKNRACAQGLVSAKFAISYAALLGIFGVAVLYSFTNLLTVIIALIGLFFYVVMYSLLLKRSSIYGTAIGAIAGATPPVVGYCAATNHFDIGAIILFLILFFWQMPHFYAIAIYRLKDYTAAAIPVLPVKKDIDTTKMQMIYYIVAFTISAIMLTLFGYTGYIYFFATLVIGSFWLYFAFQGKSVSDNLAWSRKMFMISIINIMLLSAFMAVSYN